MKRILRSHVSRAVAVALALVIGAMFQPAGPACARQPSSTYDLTKLRVVNNVLSKVRTRYVEPRRLAPRKMLLKALESIQQQVPEVIVRKKTRDGRKVEVQVDTHRKVFDLSRVQSPWALSTAIRIIFRFIQQHLHKTTKRRNVEYAAVDGILKTLDCHSILLRPRFFTEMRIHTRGSFGGLGITISRCGHPQVLTVVKPLPGTPAARAGLKAGDQIVRIEKTPTVNLTLNEAVKRLRGRPRTPVTIWVRRKGTAGLKPYTIQRGRIIIRAVDFRMLKNNVGYVRIKNFQTTTDWELRLALRALDQQGMDSLVLDLRGNGGGLLSKAIRVADAFLYSGTIVTTVEHGVKRRESRASWSTTLQGKIPMAVLVDPGTASASEIVAGALKNLDRAVIIGQRTYGKGSVQVIYPNPDRSGFKVTIAQYLTPGDRSIQGIGVIPDIELKPVELKKKKATYFSSGVDMVREGDRACSLRRASLALRAKSLHSLYHVADPIPRGFRCEPCGAGPDFKPPPDPDQFYLDYPIQLASLVVKKTRSASRRRVLQGVRALLKGQRRSQAARIAAKMKSVYGLDWSTGPRGSRPQLSARVTAGTAGQVVAGKPLVISVTATNAAGGGTAYQVRGILHSTNPLVQHREVFFGKILPGQSKTAKIQVKLARGARARADDLKVQLFTSRGKAGLSPCTVFRIKSVPKPQFAYTRQLLDDLQGNGDGRIQAGESVRIRVRVKNVGQGTAGETYVRLKNLSGDAVSVLRGVTALTGLKPGAVKTFDLQFKVLSRVTLSKLGFKLTITDCELGQGVTETLSLPIEMSSQKPAKMRGVAIPKRERIPIYQSARERHLIGWSGRGAKFTLLARDDTSTSGHYRVRVDKHSVGFVRVQDVRRRRGRRGRPRVYWRWLQSPPTIKVTGMSDVVRTKSVTLTGEAVDVTSLHDVYISVSRLLRSPDRTKLIGVDHKKVFYQANRSGGPKSLAFKATIPLWPGSNLVTIVARKSNEIKTKRTIRILRTGCAGAVAQRIR